MENKKNYDLIKIAFYAAMGLGLLYVIIFGVFSEQAPYRFLIFNFGNDMFTDFWACILDNVSMHPYENQSSYPAMACLFFAFFAKQIQIEPDGTFDISVPANNMLFVVYCLVSVSMLIGLLNSYKSGKSIEKVYFATIMLLSAPIIYMLERGNIIFIALLFLMGFVFGKDSKNKLIRELSYICLGIAAAIKIYPAVFGLLLIKDKNYKAAIRVTLYGIAFFVLPFFVYNGLSDISVMFANIKDAENEFAGTGVGGKVNLSAVLSVLLGLAGFDYNLPLIQKFFVVIPYIYMMFAIVACMFHRSNWKVMTLLSSLIVLVPGFSFVYTLIFFIIPLIGFLDSKEKRTYIDWICLLCYIAIMIPIVHNPTEMLAEFQAGFAYLFSTFIQGIAVLVMSCTLVAEGLYYGLSGYAKKMKSKK